MFIIEVIPISRGIGSDTLSYFTNKEIPIGAIINIPLRNKTISGIAISIKKASELKSEIKSANFSLKKIDKIKSLEFFSSTFMQAVLEAADYYVTTPGAVLNILIPKYILDNIGKIKKIKNTNNYLDSDKTKIIKEKYAVQGDIEERYSAWKSLIRQEFAKRKSIFFIVPTIEDAEFSYKLLERGIEGYVFMIHGSMSSKKIIETYNKIVSEKHPVVIVATGGFFFIQRNDIDTIIIENESSKSYKVQRRPYLDIRHFCELYAKKAEIKLYFADTLLRIETLWRESDGQIIQSSPFKFRSLSTANDFLIDMRQYKENNSNNGNFRVISKEIEDLILSTKNNSEHMIVLTNRRGISPTTICGDCQNIVLCNNCSSPVVLHTTTDNLDTNKTSKRFFMCHKCGERRSAEEYCKICGSWKLMPVGIGIDLVIEEIKNRFPDISIFKIDSDTAKQEKLIKDTIQKFRNKPGSILVGTELMLHYLHEKVDSSAIISIDSLFTLPDFRILEKIIYILIFIRTITTQNFIVQTRKSDEKIFEYGLKGNTSDFYRNEIEERKKYNYPPFTTLIKITLEGKKEQIIKEMEQVQDVLDPFEVEIFPAFTHTVKGNYVLHGLIRLPREKWPDSELNAKLRQLSPSVIVKVDPETLL